MKQFPRARAEIYNDILRKHGGNHAKAQAVAASLGLPLPRSAPRINGQRADIVDVVCCAFTHALLEGVDQHGQQHEVRGQRDRRAGM